MRNMETLARTLAYLTIALLTLMAILIVVLARELILALHYLKHVFDRTRRPARRHSVHTLESPTVHAPLADPALPLLPAATLTGRGD